MSKAKGIGSTRRVQQTTRLQFEEIQATVTVESDADLVGPRELAVAYQDERALDDLIANICAEIERCFPSVTRVEITFPPKFER